MVQSGPVEFMIVHASGPLDETGTTTATQSSDIAKQWYAAVGVVANEVTFKVFAICE